MRIIDLHYPKDYDLVLFGDNHYGNRLWHEKGFAKCLDFIKGSRRRRAIHMGDATEAITWADNRFDITIHRITPNQQRDGMIDFLQPVKNKIDVMLLGNHEYKLWKYGNLTDDICKALTNRKHEVKYGTLSCVIRIFDDIGLQFKMFLHHGFGRVASQAKDFEQKQGNIKASLKNKLKPFFSDVLISAMGHTHRSIIVPPTEEQLYLYINKKGSLKQGYIELGENADFIDPDKRYFINTGSFLKLFDPEPDAHGVFAVGYGELAGYQPIDLGFINIEVRNRRIKSVQKIKV